MKFQFMHKNTEVAVLNKHLEILEIQNIEHMPLPVREHEFGGFAFLNWWCERGIPRSRKAKRDLDHRLPNIEEVIKASYGLSLTDQYWIKWINSDACWEDINFLDHEFSMDVSQILFGGGKRHRINFYSPDLTCNGWLKKRWDIIEGERVLIKGSSDSGVCQEPYNEVIASAICRRLGIEHVQYSLKVIKHEPYSICKNFITKDTEFIDAYQFLKIEGEEESTESLYKRYIQTAKNCGIADIEEKINQMLILDYLMLNEDRHCGNFGVLRNADTLEYLGAAPIFDTGTSLFFDKHLMRMNNDWLGMSKPFKNNHKEQIKLVTSFDCFDSRKLDGLIDEMLEIFEESEYIDHDRAVTLCKIMQERIESLDCIKRNV